MKKLFFYMKLIKKVAEFEFSVALGLRIWIFSCPFGQNLMEFEFSVGTFHGIWIFSGLFVEKAIFLVFLFMLFMPPTVSRPGNPEDSQDLQTQSWGPKAWALESVTSALDPGPCPNTPQPQNPKP